MFFENFIQNFVENFFCNFLLWFPMAISLKNPILLWEFFSHYSRNFSSNSTQSDSFGISFGNWFGKFPVNHTLESLLKIFVRTFGWISTAIPLEILTNFKFPTILMGLLLYFFVVSFGILIDKKTSSATIVGTALDSFLQIPTASLKEILYAIALENFQAISMAFLLFLSPITLEVSLVFPRMIWFVVPFKIQSVFCILKIL